MPSKSTKKGGKQPQLTSSLEEDIITALCGKKLYGLEIQKGLENAFGDKISAGSLYPALHRLVKKGFIEAEWGDPHEKYEGARRKYYVVTALGQRVLRQNQLRRQRLAEWTPELAPQA